jgi:hypothetical protein
MGTEKENHGGQDTEQRPAGDMAVGQTLVAMSGPSLPLASINNNESAGQHRSSVKRVKGLAVVGKGLTDKYFMLLRVLVILTDIMVGIFA